MERCFGSLKNRFRIFKSPLGQRAGPASQQTQIKRNSMVIEACMILHNILIDLNDEMISELEAGCDVNDATQDEQYATQTNSGIMIRDQVKRYLVINKNFLQQYN